MSIRQIPADLQNLPTQVAFEAYARMSREEHALVDTDYPRWRRLYETSCRSVLRGESALDPHNQLSLPFQRQA